MQHTHSFTNPSGTTSLRLFFACGSLVLLSLSQANAADQTSLPSTPQELLASDPHVVATILKGSRPTPVSSADRGRIFASLPAEGAMTQLAADQQRKLTALEPLLRAADRDGVYEVRVVGIPLARMVLYERTVLLISGTVLALLSADELRGQVAHEIGHEYFAAEHERATNAQDHRRLKEIELMCDAFGMVMLHELGMNSSRLMASVEKVTLYNRRMSQVGMDESNYPTLDERRRFAAAVRRWMSAEK